MSTTHGFRCHGLEPTPSFFEGGGGDTGPFATSFKLQVEFMKLKRLVSFCLPILACCRKLE